MDNERYKEGIKRYKKELLWIIIVSYFILSGILIFYYPQCLNWNWITATVAAIGLFVVSYELDESRKANKLQALTYVFKDLHSNEARENRRFVEVDLIEKKNYKDKKWEKLNLEARSKISGVWGSFDQIAYMIDKGYLPKKDVTDMWGKIIKWCYCNTEKLLEEAKDDRAKRQKVKPCLTEQEAREYMKYFKDLAEEIINDD